MRNPYVDYSLADMASINGSALTQMSDGQNEDHVSRAKSPIGDAAAESVRTGPVNHQHLELTWGGGVQLVPKRPFGAWNIPLKV